MIPFEPTQKRGIFFNLLLLFQKKIKKKKNPNQLKVQTPKMEGFTFTIKSHACSVHAQMLTVRPHFSLLFI